MSDNVQTIWRHYPTNPHDLHGRRSINRYPRVQLYDGYPRIAIRFPHVRHWTYQREDRHRQEMHQVGRFDIAGRRHDGVVGNVLCLVHPMS